MKISITTKIIPVWPLTRSETHCTYSVYNRGIQDRSQSVSTKEHGGLGSHCSSHRQSWSQAPCRKLSSIFGESIHLQRCREIRASLHPSITIRMWRTQPGLLWIILKGRYVHLSSSPCCHQQQLEQNYILLAKQFDKIAALQKSVPWDCWRRHVQKGTKLAGNFEILNP